MCVIRNHPYPCTDTWPWDTAEQVEVALPTMPTPESCAAVSLAGGAAATDAEVIDGRQSLAGWPSVRRRPSLEKARQDVKEDERGAPRAARDELLAAGRS